VKLEFKIGARENCHCMTEQIRLLELLGSIIVEQVIPLASIVSELLRVVDYCLLN